MKNKTRLLILLIFSIIITGMLYFMAFRFNVPFNSTSNILYVGNYRETGGLLLILIILALLSAFSGLFIFYIIKDARQVEIFEQSGTPEYYKKDNLLSLTRIFQYYAIASGFILLLRDGYRAYSYDGSTQAMYIFKTDILFVMWDVILWLFIGLTVTLLIEYINQNETISE